MILYDQNTPDSSIISYDSLDNKPLINGVMLEGNKTLSELGITSLTVFNQQNDLFRLDLNSLRGSKQDKLISSVNIKTVNGQDLLGNGNVSIEVPVTSVNGQVGDVVIDVPSLIPANYITYDKLYAENYLKQVPANYVTYNDIVDYVQEISENIIPTVFIGNDWTVDVRSLQRVVHAIKNNLPWIAYAYFNFVDHLIVKGAFFEDDEKTIVFYNDNSHNTMIYTWRVDIETGEYTAEVEDLDFANNSTIIGIKEDISSISTDVSTLANTISTLGMDVSMLDSDLSIIKDSSVNYYTKSEVDAFGYVTSSNLKTINGESLIGTGNITISGGGGGTADLSNYYTKSQVDAKITTLNNTIGDINTALENIIG